MSHTSQRRDSTVSPDDIIVFLFHSPPPIDSVCIHHTLISYILDTKRSHDANNPSLASPPPWVSTLQIKSRLNSNFKFYNNNIDVNRTFLPQVFTPFLLHFLNIELSARAEQPPKSLLRPQWKKERNQHNIPHVRTFRWISVVRSSESLLCGIVELHLYLNH